MPCMVGLFIVLAQYFLSGTKRRQLLNAYVFAYAFTGMSQVTGTNIHVGESIDLDPHEVNSHPKVGTQVLLCHFA